MKFKVRTIQPRELVLIAVLSAIAVIGRIEFYWLPQFKTVTAVVINVMEARFDYVGSISARYEEHGNH